ncbi:hypothetical protein WNZ14_09305 [Hoeflea sp. AS60]
MDKHLEEYLRLCQRIYERMERDGTWPWTEELPTNNTTNENGSQ